jgi:hypothetical protein
MLQNHRRRCPTAVAPLAFTAILACCAPCLVAQARPETPHPAWTGYYRIVRGAELGDLKPISPDLDDVVIAHLQPWAREKMETTNGVADDTGAVCQPFGLFLYPPFAQNSSFIWLPTPEKIVIVYGPLQINTTGVQRIYLDRARHPANLLPAWNGDSIGHWEGDTLVVDTIGFNSKSWLQPAMEPHSEETHMIQRFRRLPNGFIEIQTTIEDRAALTSAYVWSRYFKKIGTDAPENICADYLQIWKDWRNKALQTELERSRVVR